MRVGRAKFTNDNMARRSLHETALANTASICIRGEPLFRTVGNDSTFYGPPTRNQLRRYLNQIPEDFEMCCKVWEEITIPVYAQHARYGVNAGQPNKRFLDSQAFIELVLQQYRDVKFPAPCRPVPVRVSTARSAGQ